MLRNYPGFYTYSVLERLDGWPEVEIGQIRIVYKLQQDKYFTTYKAITQHAHFVLVVLASLSSSFL